MNKFKVLLLYPNLQMVNLLPSNIALLSAYLKSSGDIEVRLFDTTLYRIADKSVDEIRVEHLQLRPFNLKEKGVDYKASDIFEDFKNLVSEFKPALIGLSATDDTYQLGIDLISKIENRAFHVIAGGVYPTFAPEEVIGNENIDSVCIGEGEEALLELCLRLRAGRDITGIKNLWVKKDGRIHKNELGSPINIDKLPYEDFGIFEEKRFFRPMQGRTYRMIPVFTDRGCPYECTFCAAPSIKRLYGSKEPYFRVKTVPRIIEELKFQIDRYGADYIYFNSETFFARGEGDHDEFAREYTERIALPFWCQTRIETITEKKVKMLKEMNCDRISIGLEHGNEEFRQKILRKTFTNKQVIEAFDILADSGIAITVNNIIGFPDETRELIFDTVKLNRRIKADSINAYFFVPYHGTPLREYCINKGYLNTHARTSSPMIGSVLNMPQISRDELKGLVRTFPLYAKMAEKYFDDIRVAERLDDEGNGMFSRLREIYFKEHFQ